MRRPTPKLTKSKNHQTAEGREENRKVKLDNEISQHWIIKAVARPIPKNIIV